MKMDTVLKDMVCRLCLKTPLTEFTIIGETAKEILDILLVKMDLEGSTELMMCKECTEMVKRSLLFKSVCVDTEEMLIDRDLFKANDDNAKLCRFCMKTVREDNFIPLDVFVKRDAYSDMIKQYMFHMDLSTIKNQKICKSCQDNMESYFTFVQNCRDTEEKINTYQRNNGVNGPNILLVNVSESCSKFARKELCNSLMEIEEFDTDIEEVIKLCTCDSKDPSQCFRCHATLKEALATEDIKAETVPSEVNNLELKIETEELIIKDEVTLNEPTSQQKELGVRMNAKQFKCNKYGPGKNYKNLCNRSEFKKKYKSRRKKHMLIHKDSSEMQMYQCYTCAFTTKHKGSLSTHVLTHKDSSETTMYRCDNCEYQTKQKKYLKRHMLVHKDPSEVNMYQCDNCEFHTKYKIVLKRHMLVHKDFSEVQMYQCDSCKFQTKHKGCLKRHMLVHKDPSEVHMYQCDNCEYQTKRKSSLKKHMLVHKDFSEVQMYQCDSCEFQTKHKCNFKKHVLIHRKSSEIQMYQCDSCKYQTRYKDSLKRHILVHKDSSQLQMYQCDVNSRQNTNTVSRYID